jgi:hypothetical protein
LIRGSASLSLAVGNRGGAHRARAIRNESHACSGRSEMVGTTQSRVNLFMNKFRKLGFIRYNGGLKVNSSLLSVVLHD